MYNICIFGGTTEGRELVEFLSAQPVAVTACVATEYGQTLLPSADNLTVLTGRLAEPEMEQLLRDGGYDLVIDATHPYASSATEYIAAACCAAGTEYLRLLRGAAALPPDVLCFSETEDAVDFLDGQEGSILLTTGSKSLCQFSRLSGFARRVYARVLPMEASLAACRAAGLKAAHIIAMQGPFSEELNLALIRAVSADWIVTKDGGEAGGFDAKYSAAQKAGARLVVIGRPPQQKGVPPAEAVALLCARFGCRRRPEVAIVGIGPGEKSAMTAQARAALERADCLIGAERMLQAAAAPGQCTRSLITAADIADFILTHGEFQRFAVVMSGDVGFFSGAKKLIPLLDSCAVTVLPGLSSLACFCARLKTSYEDVFVTSIHGRRHNLLPDVRANSRVFVLAGGENDIGTLCASLTSAGLGDVRVSIGERLSYPDERITQGTARALAGGTYAPLSVALIENEHPDAIVTPGLPDHRFQRSTDAARHVPMTKSEVRAVCLSKLQLTERAVCWDIGAGTGSVSIEMALQAKKGHVCAIEQNPTAAALLEENKGRFSVENLTVVSGRAPEACLGLPTPTHAFIGGSGGNIRELLNLLLLKNPGIRIVAAAISLESVTELTACVRELPFTDAEIVCVQVARSKQAGGYHLMSGQNPVYLFTLQGGGEAP